MEANVQCKTDHGNDGGNNDNTDNSNISHNDIFFYSS